MASVGLDVEGPDDVAPFLRFVGDELAKVGGRAGKNRAAQAGKLCLELGVGEARVSFLVELVNNLRRCVLGRADAIPLARLEARQEFSHSWDARERLRARRARYRQRAQCASLDVLDRRGHRIEHDLHLTAEQIMFNSVTAPIEYIKARPLRVIR